MMNFEEYIQYCQEQAQKIDKIIIEELESKATECVGEIQSRTPVKSGNLRRNMTHEEVAHIEDSFSVKIGSPLEYAQAVEEGHRQEVGKYIPALKKRLKKPFVEGKHMIRDSITIYQDKLEKAISSRIESEVFK